MSFGSLTWTIAVHENRAWEALARLRSSEVTAQYALTARQLEEALGDLAVLRVRFGMP